MLEDFDKDIREHIERETLENIERGMSPEEARYAALRKFGNVTRIKEDTRDVWTFVWLELLLRDVRFSFRLMRKTPGFTAVAVLTLALAIGANAVVFSVLNAMILRPMDVPHPESLYTIDHGRDISLALSYPDYLDLRDHNRSFDALAAYNNFQAGLDTGGNASRAFVDEVSGNYFDVFGIKPYLGRFFHASDEHGPNSAPYIVVNYAYWHSRFQDDPGVIGRTVQLNKHSFTVVGVAPPGFHGPVLFFTQDFFMPIVNQEQVEGQNNLGERGNPALLMTVGRLREGVTPRQAIDDLNSIGAYLEKTYPKTDAKMKFGLARPSLFGEFGGPPTRAFLTALMLLAGLILLAACANLGSLFAARSADRAREVALRLALGASRKRIVRGLFTEALLISVIGSAVGLWGSAMLLKGLSAWRPVPKFPVSMAVYPDAHVYELALLLALTSGLLFGAVPVRQVLHSDPYQVVKSGSISARGRRITVRDLLLVVQIAICAVLITSSLVAVRGYVRSLDSNFGFQPQNAMLMDTDLTMAGYRGDAVPTMEKRILEAVQTVPGVTSVGFADHTPLNGSMKWTIVFTETATDLRRLNSAANVPTYSVSPGYFRAAGTAMLSGRDFTWHDDRNTPRVAVVNQEFARKIFGSVTNATGKYYKTEDGTRVQVVGIAQDGKYQRIGEDPELALFLPILQSPSSDITFVIRTLAESRTTGTNPLVGPNGDRARLAAAIRSKLRELDSGLPSLIQTWNKALGVSLFGPRMATIALGVMGVMGAMLSVTGIFGVAAYSVSRRLKELGIRLALGAQRKDVLHAALGRPFKLLALGSVAGLLLGILASQVLASIVYQASPRDPLVLAAAMLSMASLGLVATWIPAQRALSVHPLTLLREE
jgi:predicted permease